MATSSPKIHVRFPKSLKLTKSEKIALGKAFKADVIRILKQHSGEPPPFPETNTGGIAPRGGTSSKKQSSKKNK